MVQNKINYLASIIIPTYNRSTLLAYTINSILMQSVSYRFLEIIIVDDGSTDDTPQIMREYKNRMNIKYFYQEDKGYRVATARNVGIENASSDLIILIDSGVILSPTCVEEHIKSHKLDRQPLAVIGYVYGFDQDNVHGEYLQELIDSSNPEALIERLEEEEDCLDIREDCYRQYNDQIDDLPAPWAFFWTCNVSIKKKALDIAGVFDENFNLNWGVEDLDLGFRLHQNNIKIILNRDAKAVHYPHDKDIENKYDQEMVNKIYFHNKHKYMTTKAFLKATCFNLNDKIFCEEINWVF